jgi:hypothetical protein
MDGAVNLAWISASISIGGSMLAGLISMFVAIGRHDGTASRRDATVLILFGIAILLVMLNVIAATLIGVGGMGYFGLLKAALPLSAAFALVSMAIGLIRGLRGGRA